MPTLPSNGNPTLLDVVTSFGPDGNIAIVAELLARSKDLVRYATSIEGNLPTGHKALLRTGLPTVTRRRFNRGTATSKSARSAVTDTIEMLEARNEIDVELANLNGNANTYRYSEALAFVEALGQQYCEDFIYADSSTDPDATTGLAPRYNSLSGTTAENIMSAGGAGSDNTSVYLLVMSKETITTIYPKGSKAGLQQEDLGVIDAFDDENRRFRALAELWKWHWGLHVKDWRFCVRIANIDISDLKGFSGTQADTASTWLPTLMMESFDKIPGMGMGTPVFLANRTVKGKLSAMAMRKTVYGLTMEEAGNQFGRVAPGSVAGNAPGIAGGQLAFFRVPVLTVDEILNSEAAVS